MNGQSPGGGVFDFHNFQHEIDLDPHRLNVIPSCNQNLESNKRFGQFSIRKQ